MKFTPCSRGVNTVSSFISGRGEKKMKLKGMTEKTLMTMFFILFALGAIAVLFLLTQGIFTRLVGVDIG